MRRLYVVGIVVFIYLCFPLTASAQYLRAQGWCQNGSIAVVIPGTQGSGNQRFEQAYPNCTVTVFNAGTITLSTLYADSTGTAKANPFTAAASSQWFFYASDTIHYDIQFSGGGIPTPFTISDVALPASLTTLDCTQFPGASAAAKIIACIAALPSTGGIADARNFQGAQTLDSNIFSGVTKPVMLLVSQKASYTVTVAQILSTAATVTIRGDGVNNIIFTRDAAFNTDHMFRVTGSGILQVQQFGISGNSVAAPYAAIACVNGGALDMESVQINNTYRGILSDSCFSTTIHHNVYHNGNTSNTQAWAGITLDCNFPGTAGESNIFIEFSQIVFFGNPLPSSSRGLEVICADGVQAYNNAFSGQNAVFLGIGGAGKYIFNSQILNNTIDYLPGSAVGVTLNDQAFPNVGMGNVQIGNNWINCESITPSIGIDVGYNFAAIHLNQVSIFNNSLINCALGYTIGTVIASQATHPLVVTGGGVFGPGVGVAGTNGVLLNANHGASAFELSLLDVSVQNYPTGISVQTATSGRISGYFCGNTNPLVTTAAFTGDILGTCLVNNFNSVSGLAVLVGANTTDLSVGAPTIATVGVNSGLVAANASANAGTIGISINNTVGSLTCDRTGAGTRLPCTFNANGLEAMRLTTDTPPKVLVGGSSTDYSGAGKLVVGQGPLVIVSATTNSPALILNASLGGVTNIASTFTGAGSNTAMTFSTGGAESLRINTDGNAYLGNTSTDITSSGHQYFVTIGNNSGFVAASTTANASTVGMSIGATASIAADRTGSGTRLNMTFATGGATQLTLDTTGRLLFAGVTQANLGTPANGAIDYCSDCTIANPCAGGGNGALAKRLNGVWVCN